MRGRWFITVFISLFISRSKMDKKTTQLAAVKHQLYHPRLPTLRKMDMDTVSHLLSTEHARHTTSCDKTDFTKIRTTRYPSVPTLHCKETAEDSVKSQIASYQPLDHTLRWKHILNQLNNGSPTTPRTSRIKNNNNKELQPTIDPQYSHLYIRKVHPDIAASWKTALLVKDQPHSSFVATSKPMPATIYSRYRSSRRPYSAYPWY